MKNMKAYVYSGLIFITLVAIAMPLHLESTNNIVNKQTIDESYQGLFIGDRRDLRFQPREYIHLDRPNNSPQQLEDESSP